MVVAPHGGFERAPACIVLAHSPIAFHLFTVVFHQSEFLCVPNDLGS